MSGRRSEAPSYDFSLYQTAQRVVRSILDDHASAAQVSPSGELYRAIEQRYTSSRGPTAAANSARRARARPSHGPSTLLSRIGDRASQDLSSPDTSTRSSRDTLPVDDLEAWLTPPSAASLPSLRSTTSPRYYPTMSGSNGAAGRYSRSRMADWSVDRRRSERQERAGINDAPASRESHRVTRRNNRDSVRSRSRFVRDDLLSDQVDDPNADLLAFLDFNPDFANRPANPNLLINDEGPSYNMEFANPPINDEELLGFSMDFANPPINDEGTGFAFSTASQHRPEDPSDSNRRVKRRKLDSDRISSGFTGFRYGRYGQVEPGQLTMEIVSCDGGIYSDDGRRYAVENILKNDPTVYCTEGSRCNIVLRHQGATVFTLKELVIKAPRSNYTSPVQEGMVFVSMHSDHLLTRTAQYQIQYSSVRNSPRHNLHSRIPIVSIRHNEDGTTMTNAQVRARRLYNIGLDDEDQDIRVAQIPPEFHETTPPCGVTIEYGHEDADDGDPNGWHNSSWRSRRANHLQLGAFESDSSDEGDVLERSINRADDRPRRRRDHSSSALAEAAEAAQLATQEAVRAVGGEMLTPNARFFIERDKSKCTITFDPPVSGRFILLKMWSPHQDPTGNIDIQAVVAKGFAGPRYFPAIELR